MEAQWVEEAFLLEKRGGVRKGVSFVYRLLSKGDMSSEKFSDDRLVKSCP